MSFGEINDMLMQFILIIFVIFTVSVIVALIVVEQSMPSPRLRVTLYFDVIAAVIDSKNERCFQFETTARLWHDKVTTNDILGIAHRLQCHRATDGQRVRLWASL